VHIRLIVNGTAYDLDVEPRRTLADALREDCGLTGTHLGCEHGVCGACTVLVDSEALRSCLLFAVQCEGAQIRTVEGLAPADGPLTPLQQAFSVEHALQCGFCTPGFLMLLTGALEQNPSVVEDSAALRELLTSNLCRCTGYDGIRRAAVRAGAQMRAGAERPAVPSTSAMPRRPEPPAQGAAGAADPVRADATQRQ
jgi:carbon-monoxide dehydrogenase small subunit